MTEKRYKRIRDNTTNFIVFDKQEAIKGNLDECSFEDDEVIDLLNEKDKRIKRLENQLKHCEYLIIHFQQEKENLLSDIGDRINELNSLEEVNGLAVYELERILSAIKNEAYK